MPGRPPKPAKERRTDTLRIRLNPAERGKLDKVAKAQGHDTSTWARAELLRMANDLLQEHGGTGRKVVK